MKYVQHVGVDAPGRKVTQSKWLARYRLRPSSFKVAKPGAGQDPKIPGVLGECTHGRVNRRFAASMEGAIERPNQVEEENRNSF